MPGVCPPVLLNKNAIQALQGRIRMWLYYTSSLWNGTAEDSKIILTFPPWRDPGGLYIQWGRERENLAFFVVVVVLRQGLLQPRLTSNSQRSWDSPRTSDPPVSVSQGPGIQVSATTPGTKLLLAEVEALVLSWLALDRQGLCNGLGEV